MQTIVKKKPSRFLAVILVVSQLFACLPKQQENARLNAATESANLAFNSIITDAVKEIPGFEKLARPIKMVRGSKNWDQWVDQIGSSVDFLEFCGKFFKTNSCPISGKDLANLQKFFPSVQSAAKRIGDNPAIVYDDTLLLDIVKILKPVFKKDALALSKSEAMTHSSQTIDKEIAVVVSPIFWVIFVAAFIVFLICGGLGFACVSENILSEDVFEICRNQAICVGASALVLLIEALALQFAPTTEG